MNLERWYVSRIVNGLNNEEKRSMVRMITGEFISSMSPQERKDLVMVVLPDIVDQLMSGMTCEERKDLVKSVMPLMISRLGEGKKTGRDKTDDRNDH